jgi:hypothetical protein
MLMCHRVIQCGALDLAKGVLMVTVTEADCKDAKDLLNPLGVGKKHTPLMTRRCIQTYESESLSAAYKDQHFSEWSCDRGGLQGRQGPPQPTRRR